MSSLGSESVLYDSDGSPLAVDNGVAIPADTPMLILGGSDGTNSRYIRIDSDGYQLMVGVGTSGSPAGGIITIQGDPSGTPLPISGNITASNASVSDNDLAIPAFSTLIGGSDGTNLRPLRAFDLDTGGGQQWILGVGLRKAAGGGSVEFGTSSDPIRIDPTGTTTQPISGTVTANQGGSWTVSGTGNFTVVQPTASNLRAQLASESTIGNAITSTAVLVGGSDGTNLRPVFMDSSGRQIIIGAAADGAAVAGNPVLIGGSDGTNARTIRTATDGTVRVDPTGTTTQPVSGTVTANAGSGTFTVSGTVTANVGTTGGLALDATLAKLTIAQSTALGSNTQALVGGSVTTAAPTYTTGNINPLSLTTAGALRVDGSGVTQPVSGTVTSNQGAAAALSGAWPVKVTDGTNTLPTLDVAARAGFMRITDGTNTIGTLFNTLYSDPNGDRRTIHNNATITSSSSTVVSWVGYSEWYLIINLKNAPTGSTPTIQFKIEQLDPIDQTTVLTGARVFTGVIHTAAETEIIEIPEFLSDTIKISWTVTGGSPSWTGVNVALCGHASGNAIEGQADVGTVADDPPVPVAGVDSDGYIQYLHVDGYGKLQVVISEASGTAVTRRITQNIATNTTIYNDYTVPGTSTFSVSSYYVGGTGVARSTLAKHTPSTVTFISNGDFENAGQITPWAAVTGTFTAPSPDSNSTQFQTGAASMRWIYVNSATALARRQTFTPAQDFSGYRYIRVKFFHDAPAATTRTISVILASGASTRTYSLSGTTGSAPFTNNTWVTLTCELENPTSSAGASFDLTSISTITLQMQDAANRSGTVYWDTLRLEDQMEVRHRIYTSTGDTVSAPLNPTETFLAGESLYLIVRNTGNTTQEFTAIAAGTLS